MLMMTEINLPLITELVKRINNKYIEDYNIYLRDKNVEQLTFDEWVERMCEKVVEDMGDIK